MSIIKPSVLKMEVAMLRDKNDSLIISYVGLRRWIGILGIFLPIVCIIGGCLFADLSTQRSISFYYHTNMRDFLVGLLIGVSLFLVTYRGYERIDSIATTVTGIAGFGIALFPCLIEPGSTQGVGLFQVAPGLSMTIHDVCSSAFFILLGCNSFFLFTLTDPSVAPMTARKRIRNRIYRSCGVVIFVSLATLIVFVIATDEEERDASQVVLILETIMLWAFGTTWLVKGETLLADRPGEQGVNLTTG